MYLLQTFVSSVLEKTSGFVIDVQHNSQRLFLTDEIDSRVKCSRLTVLPLASLLLLLVGVGAIILVSYGPDRVNFVCVLVGTMLIW